jgi:hypothetical protein
VPSAYARFLIAVTVDDLAANGLLGEHYPQTCWERSVETLTANKDGIAGLAVASHEQIEAYLLYLQSGAAVDILSLQSLIEDGGGRLRQLLSEVRRRGVTTVRFPKVHSEEISPTRLETLGFRPAAVHRFYAASAQGLRTASAY